MKTVNNEVNTFNTEFGERLREEREGRGLNQADFGALGGVAKVAQLNYEKGYRTPDARYLSKLLECGVDVAYLLSGQRAVPYTGRMDAKLLSRSTTAVEAALKAGGVVTDLADKVALIVTLHDALRYPRNAVLSPEELTDAMMRGWLLGRDEAP